MVNKKKMLFVGCASYYINIIHDMILKGNIDLDNSAFLYYYLYKEEVAELNEINLLKNEGMLCLNFEVEYKFKYDEICNQNDLSALDKIILEQMLPYESMCIKLARRRNSNFPIVEYEEAKRDYHKILRFWNSVFNEKHFDAAIFDNLPHLTTTYMLYGICKVKKIPMLICVDSSLDERKTYTYDAIEKHGENIKDYYQNLISIDIDENMLEDDIAEFYREYSVPEKEIVDKRKNQDFYKKERKNLTRLYFGNYMGIHGFLIPYRKRLECLCKSVVMEGNLDYYRKNKNYLTRLERNYNRVKFYKKHIALSLKTYDRLSEYPDYTRPYIYFGLQFTPEATTIPRAGVFAEQYTSVQLIAKAAEKEGVYVYVKEHFTQPFRDRDFYKLLSDIPNVKLIKTSISSFELMEKCIAAGTQTGTCILESALHGKATIVTSSGYSWKGLPGVFEIIEENQGAQIIGELKKGYFIDLPEIRKYFYAVQNSTIYNYWIYKRTDIESEKYKKSLENKKKIINKFLSDYGLL